VTLRELKAGKESQARIPFSKRKKQFSTKYLPVTAPFHSQFLANVPQMMEEVCHLLQHPPPSSSVTCYARACFPFHATDTVITKMPNGVRP
jgi:hypothetical protein